MRELLHLLAIVVGALVCGLALFFAIVQAYPVALAIGAVGAAVGGWGLVQNHLSHTRRS